MTTATTTRVVLTDEPTRHIIRVVLWHRAIGAIGEEFGDEAWVYSEDSYQRYMDARNYAQTRIDAFVKLAEQVDRVDAAEIGETLELDAKFVEAVASLRKGDLEHVGLWDKPAEEREPLLVLHAAMVALEEQFVGAVA